MTHDNPEEQHPLASSTLREVLSDHTLAVLDQIDTRRDLSRTCPPARLRAMLLERGLPVLDAALAYEAQAGGVMLDGKSARGPFAALIARESSGRRLRREDLLMYDGRPLLPVSASADTEHWLDEDGRIYLAFPSSDFCEPCDRSFTQELERFAFREERRYKKRPHGVLAYAMLGESIAAELGLPRMSAASDEFGGTWFRDGLHVHETNIKDYRNDTGVTADSIDDAVRAMDVIARVAPLTPMRYSSLAAGEPRMDEPVTRRFPCFSANREVGEILVYGAPGDYRVVQRLFQASKRSP